MYRVARSFVRGLNGYSWSTIVAFIYINLVMEHNVYRALLLNFILVFPLIIPVIYCCEKSAYLMKIDDCKLTVTDSFKRDLFTIYFSFFLACLLSLLFQYNNPDAKFLHKKNKGNVHHESCS